MVEVKDFGEINTASDSGGAGGDILINAADVTVSAQAQITSTGAGSGNAGQIAIGNDTVPVDLKVTESGKITSGITGTGVSGSIAIVGQEVLVRGVESEISTASGKSAQEGTDSISDDVGNVDIVAAEGLIVDNGGRINLQSEGAQRAGNVTISASSLLLVDGKITSASSGSGPAGGVDISTTQIDSENPGSVHLSGGSVVSSSSTSTGDAGNIEVEAFELYLSNASKIESETKPESGNGPASAGTILIKADSDITLTSNSSVSTNTNSDGSAAGSIKMVSDGGEILVTNKSNISSNASADGAAGDIEIESAGIVQVLDFGTISSSSSGLGDAGSILIVAPDLRLIGTEVEAEPTVVNPFEEESDVPPILTGSAFESLIQNDESTDSPNIDGGDSGDNRTGIFSESKGPRSTSDNLGGNLSISLAGGQLDIALGAAISADASGDKKAGSIDVSARRIDIAGVNPLANNTRGAEISVRSARTSEGGSGGNITLEATELLALRNGASVAASSNGVGSAGNIVFKAPEVIVNEFSVVENENKVTEGTNGSGRYGGGDIDVTADIFRLRNGSQITSQSQLGDSGNITIQGDNPGNLLILDRGSIVSTSEGADARAGNISLLSGGNGISAKLFMEQAFVQANAKSGQGGDITIETEITVSRNGVDVQGPRIDPPDFKSIFADIAAGRFKIGEAPVLSNVIQAATESGTSGSLTLTAPQFDVSAIALRFRVRQVR